LTAALAYYAWSVYKEKKYFNMFLTAVGFIVGYSCAAYLIGVGEISFIFGQYTFLAIEELPKLVSNVSMDVYRAATQGFDNPFLDAISMLGLFVYILFLLIATFTSGAVIKILSFIAELFRKG